MPYVKSPGGLCPLCSTVVKTLEEHEECYDPIRKIKICHQCHFYRHHQPWKLSLAAQLLLKSIRGEDCKNYKAGL